MMNRELDVLLRRIGGGDKAALLRAAADPRRPKSRRRDAGNVFGDYAKRRQLPFRRQGRRLDLYRRTE